MRSLSTEKESFIGFNDIYTVESLILAQDERWLQA